MQRTLLCLLLILSISKQALHAQSALPDYQRYKKPDGVSAPGESFTPTTNGTPTSNAPQIAEWTRSAGPDESIILTGINLSRFRGSEEGKDTRFTVYAAGGIQKDASIQRIDDNKAVITLPKDLSRWGMYLIWPGNETGYGQPLAVNKTDLWWVGPNKIKKGSIASAYGRNLANQNGTTISYVYLKATNGGGQWAEVTKVNPYRVDFRVPASLANGEYEVWVHNGHGGDYGWSNPVKFVVDEGQPWTTRVINVKDFGAKGDGVTDDWVALRNATEESARYPWCKLYFPAGTYMISNSLRIRNMTRWQGDGVDRTIIKCASNYSTRADGIIFSGGESSIEIEGMTFNTNNNFRGQQDKPIFLRHSKDIRINNVKFVCHGYNVMDLHNTERVFMTNTEVIGGVCFLGTGSQIFIDRCTFRQTDNTTTSIYSWSGSDVSVTNSTCQDFDNSNPNSLAGWGTGRFFTGDGNWGANFNTYLADNTGIDLTVNPIAEDQNMGEIFMWEGTYVDYQGNVASSTDTRTRLNSFSLTDNSKRYAVIISGKGFGQSRRIVGYNGNEILLEEPWNVTPDNSSVVSVGRYIDRIVVYNNYLDGKPRAVYGDKHVAAAGIQPFSATFNFIADKNTLHELRQGTANWGMFGSNYRLEPNYFSMFVNNKYINCREAALNITSSKVTDGIAVFGTVYRNNFVQNATVSAFGIEVMNPNEPLINSVVYEHNKVQQAPAGFVIRPLVPALTVYGTLNHVLYKNSFAGMGSGTAVMKQRGMALRENTYTGFARTYSSEFISNNTVEGPLRVINIKAATNGSPVTSSLNIWNSGSAAMSWSLSGSPSWLTVAQTNGNIENESQASTVQLTANPKGLPNGIHTAFLTVNANGKAITYTIRMNIGDEQISQTQQTQVNLTAPTQNATFMEAEPVNIAAEVVASEPVEKVEFFEGTTKIGESVKQPYTLQITTFKAGQYRILAKALKGGNVIATSSDINISVTSKTNQTPAVTVTSPSNGTTYEQGATIQITADATDRDGSIKSVRFYNGSSLIGEDFTSPYTITIPNAPAGNIALTAKAWDNENAEVSSGVINVTVKEKPTSFVSCLGTGGISWEYLYNVSSGAIISYDPTVDIKPSGTRTLSSYSQPRNFADGYGSRTRGYICPPATGMYTFYLSADDMAELWLSSDENPSNIRKIAGLGSFTAVDEYNKYSSQQSISIHLEAGKRYFVETIHLDVVRDDHLSVGWRLPNGTMQAPIQGQHLIPYVAVPKSSIAMSNNQHLMMNGGGYNPYAVKASFIDLTPNPVQSSATIRFAVTESAQTVVELYNAQGALVSRLFNSVANKDQVYQLSLSGSNLANGIYYCRLTSGATTLQKQVVIAH